MHTHLPTTAVTIHSVARQPHSDGGGCLGQATVNRSICNSAQAHRRQPRLHNLCSHDYTAPKYLFISDYIIINSVPHIQSHSGEQPSPSPSCSMSELTCRKRTLLDICWCRTGCRSTGNPNTTPTACARSFIPILTGSHRTIC